MNILFELGLSPHLYNYSLHITAIKATNYAKLKSYTVEIGRHTSVLRRI